MADFPAFRYNSYRNFIISGEAEGVDMPEFESIVKRDGAVVPFTPQRITNAIYRAAVAVGGRDKKTAEKLT